MHHGRCNLPPPRPPPPARPRAQAAFPLLPAQPPIPWCMRAAHPARRPAAAASPHLSPPPPQSHTPTPMPHAHATQVHRAAAVLQLPPLWPVGGRVADLCCDSAPARQPHDGARRRPALPQEGRGAAGGPAGWRQYMPYDSLTGSHQLVVMQKPVGTLWRGGAAGEPPGVGSGRSRGGGSGWVSGAVCRLAATAAAARAAAGSWVPGAGLLGAEC